MRSADPGTGRDAPRVDRATATLVLDVAQPHGDHNGGLNLFGPDGMLYIGLADVGQNQLEEIDIEPADAAGLNYGLTAGGQVYRVTDG